MTNNGHLLLKGLCSSVADEVAQSPSYFFTSRPSVSNNQFRTRRSSEFTQFFSAENFSSFLDLDGSGEPVREISDQELTRLGFPIPTQPPDPLLKTEKPPSHDFPMVDSPFFQIISREYVHIYGRPESDQYLLSQEQGTSYLMEVAVPRDFGSD